MRAVYTALIGDYEELNEQPIARSSTVPFICFTDDPGLSSDTWEVVLVEPVLAADPSRSSRALKLVPDHPRLAACDQTLWIDNSVILKVPPETFLEQWLDESDLGIPRHSFHDRVIDEFNAVVRAGLDDPSRVYEQLHHYLELAPHVLELPVLWNALIARRHTPEVLDFGKVWFRHVLRYSRRDQLSVRMALDLTPGVRLNAVELDNFDSPVHRWPLSPGRRRTGFLRDPLESLKPVSARLRLVELAQQEADSALAAATAELDDLRAERDRAVAQAEELTIDVTAQRVEVFALRARIDELQAHIDDIHASRTWRVGLALSSFVRPWGHRRGGRPR
jgi:hypothetical protein